MLLKRRNNGRCLSPLKTFDERWDRQVTHSHVNAKQARTPNAKSSQSNDLLADKDEESLRVVLLVSSLVPVYLYGC